MLIELSIGCPPRLFTLRSMLLAVLVGRFSKTAGSCVGHGEACRGDHDLGPLAVVGRVEAHDVSESPAECAEAGEPDVEADVGDLAFGFAEEEHRALDSSSLQVTVGRFAERRLERTDVVGFGNARHARQSLYIQGLGIGAVDGVAGTEHSTVELLDGEGHRTIFPKGPPLIPGPQPRLGTMRSGGMNFTPSPALITCHPPSCTRRWWK